MILCGRSAGNTLAVLSNDGCAKEAKRAAPRRTYNIHFRRHLGLEKKKGCGGEEEGGTYCFTRKTRSRRLCFPGTVCIAVLVRRTCRVSAASRFCPIALAGQVPRSASSNRSTTLYQTQKLTFKFIRTFAFSPQAFYPIYFIINFYFFFYFFFYLYLEKKKGCGGEEEGGTQCFTRMILP